VRQEVQRDPAAEAGRLDRVERRIDVMQSRLQPEGEQHDARHHREMEVRVRVPCERGALAARRLRQLRLTHEDGPIEVGPPQTRGDREPKQRGRDHTPVEPKARGPEADRDDRLTQRDDDDESEPLDEVLRGDAEASHVTDQRTEVHDRDRDPPEGDTGGSLEGGRDHEEDRGDHRPGERPHDGPEQIPVTATGLGEQHEMEAADHQIGDGERHGVPPEGLGRCERHQEHRAGRGEHGQPDAALLRIQHVGEPGVRGPRPPDDGEQQQAAPEPAPGGVLREERRDLREGEHDDEVEEQLEWCDAMPAFGRFRAHL
jgi:hypothetical protein